MLQPRIELGPKAMAMLNSTTKLLQLVINLDIIQIILGILYIKL